MWIKEIIIDGFKSYAHRTEIRGFDPQFNAITGLNGSGKSNILDSICFLLGITDLKQVRASNLQELVYKAGQAGVNKATVTIIFDNTNKKDSPLGYESFNEITITRQVVVGGRNKYLINGNNAQNNRVYDLFRSVQLNINNPHFLIMQGRITKVINMKPPEILSMIEEAAGTRMYETKKMSAKKTIEKKDLKLLEIDNILLEEITPTLQKLKGERSSYLEYQKVLREFEHYSRIFIAYRYTCAEKQNAKSTEELNSINNNIQSCQASHDEINDKITIVTEDIKKLEAKKGNEEKDLILNLENSLGEKKKLEAKSQSDLKHKSDTLNEEKERLRKMAENINQENTTLKNKESQIELLKKEFCSFEKSHEENTSLLNEAQQHFQAVASGLSSNKDGTDKTLADQLIDSKSKISEAETTLKQGEMKINFSNQEITKKEAELKKTERNYSINKKDFDNIEKSKSILKSQLSDLDYDESRQQKLSSNKEKLAIDVSKSSKKIEEFQTKFPNLFFDYKMPECNFDKKKVKGLLIQLLSVKSSKYSTAIEVAGGNKLFNVVVDDEITGKKLIKNGNLKRRYTFIPLNKIGSKSITPEMKKRAENLVGKDKVFPALSLIDFDEDLRPAMEFVYGNTFICDTLENAEKVAFNQKIMTRCVTLQGDVFEPAGLLSGGSRSKSPSTLNKIVEIKQEQDVYNRLLSELEDITTELNKMQNISEKYTDLKKQYDLKIHESDIMKTKLEQSTHHHLLKEIQELKESIGKQKDLMKEAKESKQKYTEKSKLLQTQIKDSTSIRDKELKDAESNLAKLKKLADSTSKQMKQKNQELESLNLEFQELQKELDISKDQVDSLEKLIKQYEEEVAILTQEFSKSKSTVKNVQEELNLAKKNLFEMNKDINAKVSEHQELLKEKNSVLLKIQELEHKVNKCNKESKDAEKQVENLLNEYDWIESEKCYFGKPNSRYDFNTNKPKEFSEKLQILKEKKENLSKKVNMRAMNMLNKAEEKYTDLMNKKIIVQNDKEKILTTIKELDEKKKEALEKAWKQVNKDFGSIFEMLLPGSFAKLDPPPGLTVLDGLEIKVSFGKVWKESLSELSGGQRSLVALSLILAMLLFKPAPLYILDEVDAALDLSHTQNIGNMLKSHFKHSQFIVVSLKDGMFNNANVLFRTKFVDGVSTVARYVQNQPLSSSILSSNGQNIISDKHAKGSKRQKKI